MVQDDDEEEDQAWEEDHLGLQDKECSYGSVTQTPLSRQLDAPAHQHRGFFKQASHLANCDACWLLHV